MGQLEQQAPGAGNPSETADTVLRAVTEELQNLQQKFINSLNEDVERLKEEKSQLLNEIEQLQAERTSIQSQRQTAQQQVLVRQIAQGLATQLQQLKQLPTVDANSTQQTDSTPIDTPQNSYNNENAYRLLASLDATLSMTFKTLQQDISSYQSSLSQQLNRMYTLEQQGEAILEALVNRLQVQVEQQNVVFVPPQPPMTPVADRQPSLPTSGTDSPEQRIPLPTAPVPAPTVTTLQPQTRSKTFSPVQIGLSLILLSAVALSLYNVAIRIILKPRLIFGLVEVGGLITPSLGNSLLILMLRMLVVVPLMAFLAPILYPRVWQDLRKQVASRTRREQGVQNKRILPLAIVSGCFLFLSQVLIYIAIGQIPTGIAITLFFVYPILTVVFSWLLFGDRPTLLRLGVICLICLGDILVLGDLTKGVTSNFWLGSSTAVCSGISFAFYVILTQICASSLHPVPFSLINFVTILMLSFLSLMVPLPNNLSAQINPANWPNLILGGIILGALTLVGYLFNNFGIRQIGAARAAIVGASGPALTAILAYLIIQETLQGWQILGMVLVTLGVAALSFERMRLQLKAAKSVK